MKTQYTCTYHMFKLWSAWECLMVLFMHQILASLPSSRSHRLNLNLCVVFYWWWCFLCASFFFWGLLLLLPQEAKPPHCCLSFWQQLSWAFSFSLVGEESWRSGFERQQCHCNAVAIEPHSAVKREKHFSFVGNWSCGSKMSMLFFISHIVH